MVKIDKYVFTSEIFLPKKIFRDSSNLFSDFSDNFNYDLKKLDISLFSKILVNLIFYGLQMPKDKIPTDFFIYALYALKNKGFKLEN